MGALGSLIPLLILFIFVAGAAFIGYHLYLWSQQMGDRGRNYMEKKHMSFTKEGGLKVELKEVKDEAYADKTQNVLVNVWNNAALPNYKSSLGWNSTQADAKGGRPSAGSRKLSSQTQVPTQQPRATASATSANLAAPRSSVRRSASPVPGSFD